jgi:tRNA U34 5-carboxymethylaminomethyl modifying GTPase MnmE/TrmE
MEAKTCCARVKLKGRWNYGTCSKVAIKDGFCKIHHPDYIKAKIDARNAKWYAEYVAKKQKRLEEETKQARIEYIAAKAPERIKELKTCLEDLFEEIVNYSDTFISESRQIAIRELLSKGDI